MCTPVCLQLDAGVPERILLLARDEAAMLVASYADLKRCIEHAYADLQGRTTAAVQASKNALMQ
jgi:PAB-dependent poly(A)-specific ribonuclease subunit 3